MNPNGKGPEESPLLQVGDEEPQEIYEPKQFLKKYSVAFVFYLASITGIAYGLILPSLERFVTSELGGTLFMYSLIIAAYSMGEIIGSLLWGRLVPVFNAKIVFICLTVLGFSGNLFYALAEDSWMILVGRLLMGLMTGGVNSAGRAYVAKASTAQSRTRIFSWWVATAAGGLALGPLLGVALTFVDFNIGALKVNEYTAPGWLLVILCFVGFFLAVFFFSELEYQVGEPIPREGATNQPSKPKSKRWETGHTTTPVLLSIIFVFACVTCGFSMIEVMITPVSGDMWGFPVDDTAYIFAIIGATVFCSVNGIRLLSAKFSDRSLALLSLCAGLSGVLICTDYTAFEGDPCLQYSCDYHTGECDNMTEGPDFCLNETECRWIPEECESCAEICRDPARTISIPQFTVGMCFLAFSYSSGRTVLSSLYSKLLALQDMSRMMSYLVLGGSVARLLVPVIGIDLYSAANHHTYLPMLTMAVLYLIALVLYGIFYSKYVPPPPAPTFLENQSETLQKKHIEQEKPIYSIQSSE